MEYNNLIQVSQYFKDEKTCKEHLAKLRWSGNVTCPFCNHDKVYVTKAGYKCANPKCYKKFTATVGTFFENTKISLRKWFLAIYIMTSHKKGISSLQLSKDIGVTQKTAWFMAHRIREMLRAKNPTMLRGIIEADETYIGGKNKNRHWDKKVKGNQGRSLKDKSVVIGLYQRNGMIISKPIENTTTKIIPQAIKENVKKGSHLITDELSAYVMFDGNYKHSIIKHAQGEYANGKIHTNTIEGFWSLLKRGIIGIYHQVSEKHLEKYCNEFNFRYNTKDFNEQNRFDKSITQCTGRLKYNELIAE
ncbi:MAG: IS1595 family transposase [Chlorobi bacterium]|nr:IS1595 family transposase [Chlorobiota bacterium]MCI0717308.1 IS1595 family transposase [Chlorobiota bacterium]